MSVMCPRIIGRSSLTNWIEGEEVPVGESSF